MSQNKTVSQWLRTGKEMLEAAGRENPRMDAELLLEKVAGMNKIQRMTEGQTILDEKAAEEYAAFLDERAKGRPLQYILGEWEFMGLPFSVGEGVLIPRADTEILVETILETGEKESLRRGLDIGTGTGCIPICLEKLGNMDMTAVDISPKALAFARENNEKNQTHVDFVESDLFAALPDSLFPLDFIVSNPPYIPAADCEELMTEVRDFEPRNALDGGKDGLDFYRKIVAEAPARLKDGGWLFFEIGYDQREALFALMEEAGFTSVACRQDLAGLDRVVFGQKKEEPHV